MRGLPGGKAEECRGDLVARERKGQLSGADCLALRAHLADCESCRVARQVFVDLDQVSGVDLRDGVRIERMSTAARRWGHHRGRPSSRLWKGRRRLRALGLAAVMVLIGGSASATVWWWRYVAPEVETVSLVSPGAAKGGRASHRARTVVPKITGITGTTETADSLVPEVEAEAADELVPPVASSETASEPAAPGVRPAVVESPRAHRAHGAPRASRAGTLSAPARLLRQASEARRGGEGDRAVGLYRKLQRQFPRSSEAVLSSVPLGGLLLDRRLPQAALGQFDAYLGSSRGGVLIPEALYGRGRALASLGDRKEERQTWDRLLADFPDSTYGPTARRRLAELK